MRKLILAIVLISALVLPVTAVEFTAPTVPQESEKYMPEDTQNFAEGLWHVVKTVIAEVRPQIAEAATTCATLLGITLLLSLVQAFYGGAKHITDLTGTVAIGVLLFRSSNSLIALGVETVTNLSEYGKLFLPVMTAILASQGGTTTSAALYTGTTLFNNILSTMIARILVPLIYVFLCFSIGNCAIGEDVLKRIRDFVKWLETWCLKTVLYVFTGYISITGVVSGSADATAIKATKLAITGAVPVVGNIISDASETILVSAGIMKGATGTYGVLALLAIWLRPFVQIGTQYVLLNITSGISGIFGSKKIADLVKDFSVAMGILLAMTGTVCLLLLVSAVCFMKGVSV